MLSTMQDVPLLVTRILQHGMTIHGKSQVTTWTGEAEPHRRSFAEIGTRATRLANALRDEFGVQQGDRVATLMWNNSEHVEAYFAIPSMGAVLHTLNLRLPPEQLVFIVNHAADRVVLVNGTLLPLLVPLLPHLPTVEHVVVAGIGDRSALEGLDVRVHDYEELLEGRSDSYDWPDLDERQAAAMCYTSGTTGDPKGVVYSHRSIYLHSMQVNMAESMGLTAADTSLVVVPQFHVNAWGLPHATFMTGINMLMPDRFLQPAPLAEMIEREKPSHAAAVPTIWQGLLAEVTANPRDLTSMKQVTIGGAACPPSLMEAYDKLGVRLCHAWGMTETSPLGTMAHPPRPDRRGGVAVPDHPGPFPGGCGGPPGRSRRQLPALGRRVRGRAGGARHLDRGCLLRRRVRRTLPARGQVQRGRLAQDRRRRGHQLRRVPHADGPGQGRHQVRR